MKIKFNHNLDFQVEAINSVVDIFQGQRVKDGIFTIPNYSAQQMISVSDGISNRLNISKEKILSNVRDIQLRNSLEQTEKLDDLDFSIEMETGTGKTYVYLKSIMEMNQKYGFKKFIIVVPSIAIKEGVHKSIQQLENDFKVLYKNEPLEYFVYDSNEMTRIESFATSSNIQIMIINIQAFNKEFTENARMTNLIHRKNEKINDNVPIELIQETNPVVIVDEPQSSINTARAKRAVASLNPLCLFRYSATHREKINVMYKLDAIDAFERKLVKQIEVASVISEDDKNTAYIKLLNVNNKKSPITARVEIDALNNGKVKRKTFTVSKGDDLFDKSGGRTVYSGYIIDEIYCEEGYEYIDFTSREDIITLGNSIGGTNDDVIKRAQIKTTIKAHLEKELRLNKKGIKVLSLFFIDKVKNYRIYNEDGTISLGKYAKWFEEEYKAEIVKSKYRDLLKDENVDDHTTNAHNGYFAQDRKNQMMDSKTGEAKTDEDIYNLIMRHKEKLLNFNSKLRFIFSHSALKEGWDNPNVFQICTLNETKSQDKKRQEIGRGLRLSVKQDGLRTAGFDINTLTVVANEAYEDFAKGLQEEYEKEAGIKFGVIQKHNFANIKTGTINNEKYIGQEVSEEIFKDLVERKYLEEDGQVTRRLQSDIKDHLFEVSEEFKEHENEIRVILKKMVDGVKIKNRDDRLVVQSNKEVILSEDFQDLWNKIKHKTTYSVKVDTEELIYKCVKEIKKVVRVNKPIISLTKGLADISSAGVSVGEAERKVQTINYEYKDLPDIVSSLQNETDLTRLTIAKILEQSETLHYLKENPTEYIEQLIDTINRVKRLLLVDGIKYTKIGDEEYSCQELFLDAELTGYLSSNLYEAKSKKTTHEYVVYDSDKEKSFAQTFDKNSSIKLYAKLPSSFKISTPLGTYNPDWAVLVEEDGTEKMYFVIETKGNVKSEHLKILEDKKIQCGKRHFEALDNGVEFAAYDDVDRFTDDINISNQTRG